MAKSKAVPTPDIYVVLNGPIFDSVHACITSANARSASIKAEGKDGKVEVHQIQGGTVNIDAGADAQVQAQAPKAAAPKESAPKAAPKKEKATKVEPEAAPAAKKTQTLAEQRAANTGGSKADDEELPENMKALLASSGAQLSGLTVVVTGVPPTLGRKNADKLVENYGGKLGKSLSKNTDYVILGNKAGPKK
jgi:BRCT domain type II-containing protein